MSPKTDRIYRWQNPHEWILFKMEHEWNAKESRYAFKCLLDKIDTDDIQEIFQNEMIDDGYFQDIT